MSTAVAIVSPDTDGIAPAVGDPTDTVNGNHVSNQRGLLLVLNNTGASSRTVTFTTPRTVSGYAVADLTVTIPAGQTRFLAGFDVEAFGSTMEFMSSNAEVTVAAYFVA